ncbi:MAG: hypothetical protein ACLPGW_02615 [Roseiarcus sp.]
MLPLNLGAYSPLPEKLASRDNLCLEKSQICAFIRPIFAHNAKTFIITVVTWPNSLDDGAETPVSQENQESP